MPAARRSPVLLALLLALPAALPLGAAASDDADAPVVTGWSFNAETFEPGDVFTVTFNVSDASEVRSAYFSLAHESGQTGYTVGFEGENRTSGRHNASFTWLDDVRGNYTVQYVYTEDAHGNRQYLFASSGGFPEGAPTRVFLGPSQVDVRVTTFFGPSFADAGEAARFDAAVQNMGDRAVGPFNVTYLVDEAPARTLLLPGLASGEIAWVPFNWTAVAGDHVVRVVADPWNAIAEDDEGDNEANITIHVSGQPSPQPDLYVLPLDARPSSPTEGDLVYVNATVGNRGNASASFAVSFLVNGSERQRVNVTGLGAGQATNLTFRWEAVRGIHHLAVVADREDAVAEPVETDNAANVTLKVAPPPADISVGGLRAPSNATEGDLVPVSATLLNKGGQPTGGFFVDLVVDGWPAGREFVSSISPGGAADVSFTWHAKPGVHDLAVVADSWGFVNESDRGNNAASVTVTVEALPPADVAARILGVSRTLLRTDLGPLAPNPLHPRAVTVEVSNGGVGGSGEVTILLYAQPAGTPLRSGSSFYVGSATLDPLAPGGSGTVEITWDPSRFLGDVDLVAFAVPQRADADHSNNQDVYRDFVLVGGTGFGVGP